MSKRAGIPRNPDSRAAEKLELSALKDAERTNGPVSESRIGRVFIWGWLPGCVMEVTS
jgi:hypothetical protein